MLVAATPSLRSKLGAYVSLTKPQIIELLLVTTVPTQIVAAEGLPSLWLVVTTVVGGALAAGGAHAVNMYVDRDIDRLMARTQHRPLVTGVIEPRNALVFAVVLEVLAFALLWSTVNLLSAVLALAACLFYVFVYTLLLKRTSTQNIVIGGAAGAVPTLIGWSSVTGTVEWPAIVLFGIIFFWTPPHFWALAIKYKDDYSAAEVPMLPSVAEPRTTCNQIVAYTLVTWALTLLFAPVAGMGAIYLLAALGTGAFFTAQALKLRAEPTAKRAMRLFGWSITHVTLLFGAMALDELVRSGL
ncbi:MAG TPA: heme o synthase [Acidimicrobiales bacterium]|nr:heme o synthase [Acidimicrobiales bacterium]